eukprot:COSAG01_NODE_3423_length_6115_cov_3.557347_5_plen_97_part_00
MFQLHLPRYSSREILKQRLLCAIQDGGSRSDRSTLARRYLDDDEAAAPAATTAVMPPTVAVAVPADGGHLEDLPSFCERLGVGLDSLKSTLGVIDM